MKTKAYKFVVLSRLHRCWISTHNKAKPAVEKCAQLRKNGDTQFYVGICQGEELTTNPEKEYEISLAETSLKSK